MVSKILSCYQCQFWMWNGIRSRGTKSAIHYSTLLSLIAFLFSGKRNALLDLMCSTTLSLSILWKFAFRISIYFSISLFSSLRVDCQCCSVQNLHENNCTNVQSMMPHKTLSKNSIMRKEIQSKPKATEADSPENPDLVFIYIILFERSAYTALVTGKLVV